LLRIRLSARFGQPIVPGHQPPQQFITIADDRRFSGCAVEQVAEGRDKALQGRCMPWDMVNLVKLAWLEKSPLHGI